MFSDMSLSKFLYILIGGFKFDTTAIIYTNSLFIVLNILPFPFRHNHIYQITSKYTYIICNSIALLANSADVVYYKFTLKRTTSMVFSQFANEENMLSLSLQFIVQYWYMTLLFAGMIIVLIKLYDKFKISERPLITKRFNFYTISTIVMFVILFISWGGVRGGFRHSTRPITLSNAGKYVEKPNEMSIVLNTPFAIIRTIGKQHLSPIHFFESEEELNKYYSPIHYADTSAQFKKENVVIFILESWSKEFVGFLNKDLDNGKYEGYTPFFDSILSQSLTFKYAYASGRKSIDALPSVLSSIPHIKVPFVLSHYSANKTRSMAQHLNDMGYHTAFFHGAPNGSMGFQSFIKLAGFDQYYGKTEYNNDDDFDEIWGIWDEEFFQYFGKTMSTFKEPFMTALFSLSSHHPFQLPEKHKGEFKEGFIPLHKCIRYTDYALRKFFEYAKTQDWYNNTLFVFTADHASFPYREEYKNDLGGYAIPICFYKPNGSLKKFDTSSTIQQIDIMPTILSYLGYPKDFFSFGKNILDTTKIPTTVIYNNHNFYGLSSDFALQFNGNTTTNFFNFKDDIYFRKSLLDKDSIKQVFLEKTTKAYIQQFTNRMIENKLLPEN